MKENNAPAHDDAKSSKPQSDPMRIKVGITHNGFFQGLRP